MNTVKCCSQQSYFRSFKFDYARWNPQRLVKQGIFWIVRNFGVEKLVVFTEHSFTRSSRTVGISTTCAILTFLSLDLLQEFLCLFTVLSVHQSILFPVSFNTLLQCPTSSFKCRHMETDSQIWQERKKWSSESWSSDNNIVGVEKVDRYDNDSEHQKLSVTFWRVSRWRPWTTFHAKP